MNIHLKELNKFQEFLMHMNTEHFAPQSNTQNTASH
jgi:hypothetical protein